MENSTIDIHDVDHLRRHMQGRTFSWMKNFPNYQPITAINPDKTASFKTKSI